MKKIEDLKPGEELRLGTMTKIVRTKLFILQYYGNTVISKIHYKDYPK